MATKKTAVVEAPEVPEVPETPETTEVPEVPENPDVPEASAASKEQDTETLQPTHLSVRALVEGFRRAGRAWSDQETRVPISEFSRGEIAQLLDDKDMVCDFVFDDELIGEQADA